MTSLEILLKFLAVYNALAGLALLALSLYTLTRRRWGRWMRLVQAGTGLLAAAMYLAIALGVLIPMVYARFIVSGLLSTLLAWEILMQSLSRGKD